MGKGGILRLSGCDFPTKKNLVELRDFEDKKVSDFLVGEGQDFSTACDCVAVPCEERGCTSNADSPAHLFALLDDKELEGLSSKSQVSVDSPPMRVGPHQKGQVGDLGAQQGPPSRRDGGSREISAFSAIGRRVGQPPRGGGPVGRPELANLDISGSQPPVHPTQNLLHKKMGNRE